MGKTKRVVTFLGISALALMSVRAADDALSIHDADCPFFGASHDKLVQASLRGFRNGQMVRVAGALPAAHERALSALTDSVTSALAAPPPGTRTGNLDDPATSN